MKTFPTPAPSRLDLDELSREDHFGIPGELLGAVAEQVRRGRGEGEVALVRTRQDAGMSSAAPLLDPAPVRE